MANEVSRAMSAAKDREIPVIKVGATVFVVGLLLLPFGDDIERTVWPILTELSVSHPKRTGTSLCWTITYTKQRESTLTGIFGILTGEDRTQYNVLLYSPLQPLEKKGRLVTLKPGKYVRPFCAEIPKALENDKHLQLNMQISYDIGIRPWATIVTFPQVDWPDEGPTPPVTPQHSAVSP